jgi:hypothetical protein
MIPGRRAAALASSIAVSTVAAAVSRAAFAEWEIYSEETQATKLVLNVDVAAAWYNSNDSWFGESQSFLGANTDHWAEIGLEPTLSFETRAGNGILFAGLSGVYTSTSGDDASGLTVGLTDKSSFTLEQGHMGWRGEDIFDWLEGDTLTIAAGRQDYSIGTGLLINDGGADGAERGGWYLNMRSAFSESLLATIDSDTWMFEVFRLKNQPRAGGTQGEAYGLNVEYDFSESFTLGTTYMKVDSNLPGSETLDVYSARASWRGESGFGLAGEYADESSSQIDATGYYGEVSYEAANMAWSPVFSYRYAHFDGDNLATPVDERFRELAYGFTDWGSWFQGEITGEYALGNGNLESHLIRVAMQPREGVAFNVLYYDFKLDRPLSFLVLSDDWGDELNFTLDWDVNERVAVTAVLGALFPGDAAKQLVGNLNADEWMHAMLYISYSW